ncbi:MAG: BBP7 family outer membrane beta-barrel protein [Rubripirellula sp.]
MKMNFRGLAFTAMLLSGTSMAIADQGAAGDLPGYGEDAYFHEEAAYAQQQVAPVAHAESALHYAPSQSPHYAPVGASQLQPASFGQRIGGGGDCGCEVSGCDGGCNMGGCDSGCGISSCDGGCDSGCSSKRRSRFGNILSRCDSDTWASAEFLMWFTQDRDMPALVTTGAPGSLGTLAEASTQTVFGDDINGELSGGFRGDYGKWLGDNIGVGGRFWILAENQDSVYLAGNGNTQTIARPFFDPNLYPTNDGQNSFLIGNNLGGGVGGAVAAESSLDMMAMEAYGRFRFSCNNTCRLDFIGGYSHFEIDDELRISSFSEDLNTAARKSFSDQFNADNEFNGGQLGFEMTITRGRWMARSLTKVHLGNMQQSANIVGQTVDTTAGGASTSTSGGLLARGNQGQFERDVFAFAPEANFKLAYKFRPNVLLSVGYSFMYFDNVMLNGDIVDNVINNNDLIANTLGPRPAWEFNDSSLWVQGLDLGFVIDF